MSRTLLRNLLVKGGNLSLALENLFGVEKITRQVTAIQRRLIYQGQDMVATKTVAIAILKLCVERGDWASINSSVTTLSKRRGQFKQVRLASLHLTSSPLLCPFQALIAQVVTQIVQDAMALIPAAPTTEIRLELIHTLRAVSEGKVSPPPVAS
jgi:hypothetical protein